MRTRKLTGTTGRECLIDTMRGTMPGVRRIERHERIGDASPAPPSAHKARGSASRSDDDEDDNASDPACVPADEEVYNADRSPPLALDRYKVRGRPRCRPLSHLTNVSTALHHDVKCLPGQAIFLHSVTGRHPFDVPFAYKKRPQLCAVRLDVELYVFRKNKLLRNRKRYVVISQI